ncbi:MAG: glutamate 5-kinase [Actinomycetota bacterium]
MIAALNSADRVVIKVGSSSITGANAESLHRIADAIATLRTLGKEVLLVSSGAIATGSPLLGLSAKPDDLATSQALAGVGQARLMARYQASFERHEIICAQMLLTVDNLESESHRRNALNALERLLQLRVMPIINENDSVATQEIRFGDNDQLAARVAVLAQAQLLVLLSDVDGIYSQPPQLPGAVHIPKIEYGAQLSEIEVSGTSTGYGTGGAVTKLAAARLATSGGVAVVICSTADVARLANEAVTHTFFEPNPRAASEKS